MNSGSLFGGASNSQAAKPNLFGNTQTASTGGLFGGQQTPSAPSGGLFGGSQSQAPATSSGGLFGKPQSQTQATSSGGLFGGQTQTASTGGFGGQAPAAPSGGLFGGQQGQGQAQQSAQTSSLLGGQSQAQQQPQNQGQNPSQSTQPAFFNSLLERGKKRPLSSANQSNNFEEVPSLQLGLSDIRRKARELGSGGQKDTPNGTSSKA